MVFVSIDDIVAIVQAVFFNPVIVLGYIFYLFRFNTSANDYEYILPQIWAIMLITYKLVQLVLDASRMTRLDRNLDVVAVTGGASGLGNDICKLLALKKIKVAALDIVVPSPSKKIVGVSYYRCDVGNNEEVIRTLGNVERDLGQVTVLINNAGIARRGTVLEMSLADVRETVDVNFMAIYHTVKAVLSPMVIADRGYIVTVASSLGYQGPIEFAAYGATKSAAMSFHESLTYELASHRGIKTLLVVPGQMQTAMFSQISPPFQFFAPVVDPNELAKSIVHSLEVGRTGKLAAPFYVHVMPVIRALPEYVVSAFRWASGMDRVVRQSNIQNPTQ
ncbi:NAD(P)-binding protein [Lipomyces oligophaga]|uniref:NAD(P)-binding protein n=1 Tax=Lipomyces oligophaga TaxID=45792 RepID=UPI0034CD0699